MRSVTVVCAEQALATRPQSPPMPDTSQLAGLAGRSEFAMGNVPVGS